MWNTRDMKSYYIMFTFTCILLSDVPAIPKPKFVHTKHTTVNITFNTNSHAQIGTEHFIFLFFIEFQCTHGLLGCHGEKAVTSELKFRHFFTIPLTVKV